MSTCIKDLHHCNLVKKNSKCGFISIKINFHTDIKIYDVLTPHCKLCRKPYRKKYYI